jgi:hypothetical protein
MKEQIFSRLTGLLKKGDWPYWSVECEKDHASLQFFSGKRWDTFIDVIESSRIIQMRSTIKKPIISGYYWKLAERILKLNVTIPYGRYDIVSEEKVVRYVSTCWLGENKLTMPLIRQFYHDHRASLCSTIDMIIEVIQPKKIQLAKFDMSDRHN